MATKTIFGNKDVKVTRPVGRPTLYDEKRHVLLAQMLAREDFTEADIASVFRIGISTLSEWKLLHPEFGEALKSTKVETDNQVSNALLKRALGYDIPVEEVKTTTSEKAGNSVVVTRSVRHIPSDTVAAQFWLANRRHDRWRRKDPEPLPEGDPTDNLDVLAELLVKTAKELNDRAGNRVVPVIT